MKRFFNWFTGLFSNRRSWVRQITVAAIASATAWIVGDNLVFEGGLVAAIVCALSIRISLYKSVREGLGQIVGTAIWPRPSLTDLYRDIRILNAHTIAATKPPSKTKLSPITQAVADATAATVIWRTQLLR